MPTLARAHRELIVVRNRDLRFDGNPKGAPMTANASESDVGLALATAIVGASDAPMLLLDGKLLIIAASSSFCTAFGIDSATVSGISIYDLDNQSWNVPRLRSLLNATVSGLAVGRYELEIALPRLGRRLLVLKADKLDYGARADTRLLVTVADVTDTRLSAKANDDLVRDKALLVQEVQHRVANSLQIIASILMQSARGVQSEEARGHLTNAHQRVMSIASLQAQLAETGTQDVALAPYLTQLCDSIGASMIYDHQQLKLTTDIDKSSVAPNISVSMGLVVTELVINALKHAFPGNRLGHVEVAYKTQGTDWTLSVTDDGVGMPAPPHKAQSGLGTNIVKALAKQLLAEIEITDAAPGTRVSLTHVRKSGIQDAANDVTD